MKFYWLVLGILTVWRITHFLQAEDGPWDIVIRLRTSLGEGFWGKLLDCFYCLSVWIAVPLAIFIGESWWERGLLWPSLSAGAMLVERVTNLSLRVPPAPYAEEKNNGMLRTEETADNKPSDPSPPDQ